MKTSSTSVTVAGLGAAVTTIGLKKFKGNLGAGVVGFGLAHIVLGLLDMLRPTVKS